MKSFVQFGLFLFLSLTIRAQCTAGFSYYGLYDTISFTNTSQVNYGHIYWNFGDGQTSGDFSPVHRYPGSGHYLVSLYILDTLSGCHDVEQIWIDVVKPSNDPCVPSFTDNIINNQGLDYIHVVDASANCNQYYGSIDCGPALNFPPGNWIGVSGWGSALFMGRIEFYVVDSTYGYAVRQEYYRTRPYNYDDTTNYGPCSADFEYHIDPQATGSMVTLHAMNRSAQSYQYSITGFGNPIPINSLDAGFFYPYQSEECFPWLIHLQTVDSTGCRDSLTHQILICNPFYVEPPNCAMTVQPPANQIVVENDDAEFIIETDPRTRKEWYMDDGTGLIALTNSGPFSGVYTDTLKVNRATLSMNNYNFKCKVSSNLSGCSTSSSDARLTVVHADLIVFPNPTDEYITFIFTSPDTISTIKICNNIGQEIYYTTAFGPELQLNLSFLTSGTYMAEVRCRNSVYRKRIVKTGDIR